MGLQESFKEMVTEYNRDDSLREDIINRSRAILKPAKQAIYAVHRNDLENAEQLLINAKEQILACQSSLLTTTIDVGSFNAALEEYIESKCYYEYVKNGSIPTAKELDVKYSVYLSAICDLSGELARRAVILATNNQFDEVKKINNFLDEITELFLHFDFRGGDMRKKVENLKYNLAKVQNILYDISLKVKL